MTTPDAVYFQADTWQGQWREATPGNPSYSGTLTSLQPGFHILYAFAGDGQEATSTQAVSPLTGAIQAYGFLVLPPPAQAIKAKSTPVAEAPIKGSFTPLAVTAMDAYNNPVWGVGMTFTAPTSGPSGTFSSGTSTITVVTGSDGVASAPFTANQIPGSYLVFASATSEAEPKSSPYRANASAEEVALSPVSFSLTNTGYALSASPNFFSVAQGYSGTSTITSTVVEFSSPVTLSASGQPAGVNVTFSPASITSAGTSTMTVTVASTTATGSYPITITGASGNTTNKTTFTLTVTSLISGGPPAIVSLSPSAGAGTSVNSRQSIRIPTARAI